MQQSSAKPPAVTVIMPVRNEADFIARSLGAVLDQDYPANQLEVLVVDGMSDDATRNVIAQTVAAKAGEVRVTVLDNPGRIVPTAMNIGLLHARGDIIVRVDGHCEIAPDYVHRCVEALEVSGADNVGGLQRAAGGTVVARAIALANSSPFGVGGARFHYATQAGWADTVYLGAYCREVFNRIGGYDEELVRNQDDELNFRLTQAGGKIWLDPSIRSVYYSRGSLGKLWRQYYEYGLYKVLVMRKRGGVASWRHLTPAAFVLSLVLSLLLALVTRRARLALLIAGPYAAANGAASLWTVRRDPRTLAALPLAFATMHCAYGLGFIVGMWHWRNWRRD
jgi:succinoglycan biosynthesis protein ExoA